jgi:hypothetical protein
MGLLATERTQRNEVEGATFNLAPLVSYPLGYIKLTREPISFEFVFSSTGRTGGNEYAYNESFGSFDRSHGMRSADAEPANRR